MGDMPPSMTEEGLRVMVEEFGCIENLILRSYRDGGKWAMVNVRDKEEGQKIIDGLHMSQLKGRELTVKWKEEGMWTRVFRKIYFSLFSKCKPGGAEYDHFKLWGKILLSI